MANYTGTFRIDENQHVRFLSSTRAETTVSKIIPDGGFGDDSIEEMIKILSDFTALEGFESTSFEIEAYQKYDFVDADIVLSGTRPSTESELKQAKEMFHEYEASVAETKQLEIERAKRLLQEEGILENS